MKIIDYKTAIGEDSNIYEARKQLNSEVQELIAKGFVPLGSISITSTPALDNELCLIEYHIVMAQAMVRELN